MQCFIQAIAFSLYHSHIAVLQFVFFFPRIAEIFSTIFMFDIFTYS